MISFFGRLDLKSSVLAQMEAHHRSATLADLLIDGRTVNLYGWSRPLDVGLCARVLGLPEDLLHLGCQLTEGFPESAAATREVIRLRAELIGAMPVGEDLSRVVPELLLWLLFDTELGPARFDDLSDALLSAAEALETRVDGGQAHDARAATARALEAAWRALDDARVSGQAPPSWAGLAERVRAAECAALVVEYVQGRPAAAAAAVASLLNGARGLQVPPGAAQREERVHARLMALLAGEAS